MLQKSLIGLSLILLVTGLIMLIYKSPKTSLIENLSTIQKSPVPSASPFEAEDMTIPYLRAKSYQNSLGERKKYTENGNYTSYLTNYTSDGLKINGLLAIPTSEKPTSGWPAIVFIHGYIPPTIYKTTERYVDYVDYLARNGFVVFKIDLRGHDQSEGEPGGAYYSSDYIIDALNAYSALQSADFVNPKAIGLWGHSMAGNVVLRSIAAKPEIPAAVIWAGAGYTYTDLQQYRITDLSYRPIASDSTRQRKRQRIRDLYGDPDPNNWFWKMVIPTNYLGDYKGAIELHHAVDDNTVNIEYSRNLNSILDKTQIPHQFFEYPTGDHNITNPSFTPAMQRTVEFYKKYLNS